MGYNLALPQGWEWQCRSDVSFGCSSAELPLRGRLIHLQVPSPASTANSKPENILAGACERPHGPKKVPYAAYSHAQDPQL